MFTSESSQVIRTFFNVSSSFNQVTRCLAVQGPPQPHTRALQRHQLVKPSHWFEGQTCQWQVCTGAQVCVCETVWLLVPSCHSFIHSSIHPSIYPPILPSFHPSIHPSAQKVFTYQGIRYKCYDRWRINTIPVLMELTAYTSGSQPWPGELLKHTKILGSF